MARSILIQILGDASSLERSFKKAGDSSDKFGKRMGVSMKSFAKAGAVGAAAGGVALVTKQLFSAVDAAKEAQKAEARLNGAFKAAGVSARQRAQALQAVSKVSKTAALDDEDLSDVLANLTRTTGSAEKGMKGMALAADIARARNIKLSTAAKIVEKAHTGSLTGLKKLGVEVDKNTTSTEALERAQRKFAGSAERYGKTAAGAQDKLGVAFENLQEKVGQKLLPVLTKLSLKLVKLIEWSEKNWPKFAAAIQPVVAVVKAAFERLGGVINAWVDNVRNVVKLIQAIANGEWGKAWGAFKDVVVGQVKLIWKAFGELPAKILKALGAKAWDGLKAIGSSIKNAAMSGLQGLANALVSALEAAINRMIGLANSAIGKFNAIPLAPDIPKIPTVGGNSASRSRPSSGAPRSSGRKGRFDPQRAPASVGAAGSQTVTLNVDGRELGSVIIGRTQRAGRETAASRRGPFAGQKLALS